MAYRLFREFRQAFTRLDTPPLSIRHHSGSAIARVDHAKAQFTILFSERFIKAQA
jgi:hypothetical protein